MKTCPLIQLGSWSGLLGFTLTEQAKLGLIIQASKDPFFTKEDLCDKMLILLIGVGEREG